MEFSADFSSVGKEQDAVKASNFSDAQKAFILKQGADGISVVDICRKGGISQRLTSIARRSMTGCCRRRCGG